MGFLIRVVQWWNKPWYLAFFFSCIVQSFKLSFKKMWKKFGVSFCHFYFSLFVRFISHSWEWKKNFFFLSILAKRRKLTEEHIHNYRTDQKVHVDTPLYEYGEIDHISELVKEWILEMIFYMNFHKLRNWWTCLLDPKGNRLFLVTQVEGFCHVTFYNKNLNLLLKRCATIFFLLLWCLCSKMM